MSIGIHPDASERFEIVFVSDEVVEKANSEKKLTEYMRTGELARLRVPASATRAWVAPLSLSARSRMASFVDVFPGEDATEGQRLEYNGRCAYAAAIVGLKKIDAFPDVETAKVGSVEEYPFSYIERLPYEVVLEISAHVHRISALNQPEKAAGTNPRGKADGSSTATPAA